MPNLRSTLRGAARGATRDALRWALAALALLTALALSACAAPQPVPDGPAAASPNDGPFRTRTVDGVDGVMLEGYDAVAYFASRSALRGSAQFALQHKGVTWFFATPANRAEFERNPARYMPQFGGYCSNGINYAIPGGGGGGPDTWRIYRGRLYVFGGKASRDHFEMDTELNLRRAHHYWNTDVAGANPTLTRIKRMVSRVPHYQSDRALQAQWEAGLAAKTLPVMPGQPQVVPATP